MKNLIVAVACFLVLAFAVGAQAQSANDLPAGAENQQLMHPGFDLYFATGGGAAYEHACEAYLDRQHEIEAMTVGCRGGSCSGGSCSTCPRSATVNLPAANAVAPATLPTVLPAAESPRSGLLGRAGKLGSRLKESLGRGHERRQARRHKRHGG